MKSNGFTTTAGSTGSSPEAIGAKAPSLRQPKRRLVRVVTRIQEPDWKCPHNTSDMEWVHAPNGDGMIHRCKKCGFAYLEKWVSQECCPFE
jgi:hypothetical protein